ncbi:MAG TPA: nucleoside hydrolase [Candidatus Limnocylindrales bacterium]|nr:nucleoside hydrolase [Candidatus Limnocylindrales bacterium]
MAAKRPELETDHPDHAAALSALPGAPPPGRSRPIILDCDPGHDDALAIALACASPELEVLALTTVAGNAPLELTTRNARRVLALLGREDIPVAAGADRPLVHEPWVPSHVHGASGLDGADLPEPTVALRPEAAIELQVELLRRAASPVTLVPTGPLTNIALLLRAFPAIRDRIGAISLMGGALGVGNTTASAEFNIWHDPEAAAIVFESGIPILMAGLDVTHQALVLPDDVARLEGLGTRTGRVFADLMRFFGLHHAAKYGWAGPPVHDAVAVAVLVAPWLLERRSLFVAVQTGDGLTRGRTVGDERGVAGRAPNAEVLVHVDRPAFVDLVVEAVARFA